MCTLWDPKCLQIIWQSYKWLFGSQYYIIKHSQYLVKKYFKLAVLRLKWYKIQLAEVVLLVL